MRPNAHPTKEEVSQLFAQFQKHAVIKTTRGMETAQYYAKKLSQISCHLAIPSPDMNRDDLLTLSQFTLVTILAPAGAVGVAARLAVLTPYAFQKVKQFYGEKKHKQEEQKNTGEHQDLLKSLEKLAAELDASKKTAYRAEKMGRYTEDRVSELNERQELLNNLMKEGKKSSPEQLDEIRKRFSDAPHHSDESTHRDDPAGEKEEQHFSDPSHSQSEQEQSAHLKFTQFQQSHNDARQHQTRTANRIIDDITAENRLEHEKTKDHVTRDGEATRDTVRRDGEETRDAVRRDGEETRTTVRLDGEKTRDTVRLDGAETRLKVQEVGDLVKIVIAQADGLNQTLTTIASDNNKRFDEVQANQLSLAHALLQGIDTLYQEHQKTRQQLWWLSHDAHFTSQYLAEMDRRNQENFATLFGADYENVRHSVTTYHATHGKPTDNGLETMRSYFTKVIGWATIHAKSSTVTGMRPGQFINDINMQKHLITILSRLSAMENNINYWVGYAHDVLGVQYDNALVNPLIWSDCASLVLFFPELLPGFSNNPNLKKQIDTVFSEGAEILKFMVEVKTNPRVFEQLISDYADAVKNVVSEVKHLVHEYAQENIIKFVAGDYDRRLTLLQQSKNSAGGFIQDAFNSLSQVAYAEQTEEGYVRKFAALTAQCIQDKQESFAFSCENDQKVVFCSNDLINQKIEKKKQEYLRGPHNKRNIVVDRIEANKYADREGYVTEVFLRKSEKFLSGTKEVLKWECGAGRLDSIAVDPTSHNTVTAGVTRITTKVKSEASTDLTFLINQAAEQKRKLHEQSNDPQLPFDLFKDVSDDSPSSWMDTLRSVSEHVVFSDSNLVAKLAANALSGLNAKNKKILKLWLQAEYLGHGEIHYSIAQTARNVNDITVYQADIKFISGHANRIKKNTKEFQIVLRAEFPVFNSRDPELSDCALGLKGFTEAPCGFTNDPRNTILKTWLDYKFRNVKKFDGMVFVDQSALLENNKLTQTTVNAELVKHRQSVTQSIISKLSSFESSVINQALIYVDAAAKKLAAFVAWTYPELIERAEFKEKLTAIYDKEKIMRHILHYQQDPHGKFIHQVLEDILTKPLIELKTFILNEVKIAKTLRDEELLDVRYPLVQDTLGLLTAFDHHHFSSVEPKIYTAVEIYRMHQHDDQEEILKLRAGKNNILVVNKQGNTALHLAVKLGDIETFIALLPIMSAAINLPNGHQQTPMDLALLIEDAKTSADLVKRICAQGNADTRCSRFDSHGKSIPASAKAESAEQDAKVLLDEQRKLASRTRALTKQKEMVDGIKDRCEAVTTIREMEEKGDIEPQKGNPDMERAAALCNSIFGDNALSVRIEAAKVQCCDVPSERSSSWQPTFFNGLCNWLTRENGFQKIADVEAFSQGTAVKHANTQ
ncbi:MAG: ankyrin repeat domain-containing protein [Gammaproteobacteria bacterium]|nr:ankyrin repeat domain-containing protein [Gammaproteobacteria bacterium]